MGYRTGVHPLLQGSDSNTIIVYVPTDVGSKPGSLKFTNNGKQ